MKFGYARVSKNEQSLEIQVEKLTQAGCHEIYKEKVSGSCNNEKLRISNKLYTIMDSSLRKSLSKLLEKDDLFYQLTLIKKDQKDFTTNEINSRGTSSN